MYPMTNKWGEKVPKGETKDAIKAIREHNKQLAWFLDNYKEMEIRYSGLYVGIQDKEVKVAKETIEEVKEGVDTNRVYLLKYVPTDHEPEVLDKKLANMGLDEYSDRLKEIDNGNMEEY